eukprot:scaffold43178_cov33-Tisochrysis_lutea.AAC.2
MGGDSRGDWSGAPPAIRRGAVEKHLPSFGGQKTLGVQGCQRLLAMGSHFLSRALVLLFAIAPCPVHHFRCPLGGRPSRPFVRFLVPSVCSGGEARYVHYVAARRGGVSLKC